MSRTSLRHREELSIWPWRFGELLIQEAPPVPVLRRNATHPFLTERSGCLECWKKEFGGETGDLDRHPRSDILHRSEHASHDRLFHDAFRTLLPVDEPREFHLERGDGAKPKF